MNYAEYRKLLVVNKHNLDAALEVSADIMERISAEVTRSAGEYRQCKDDLAAIEGELSADLKGEKTNAEERAARIKRNPQRQARWKALQLAQLEAEQWSHLLDAWKQRGFSIKTLSDLYAANYFTVNSHQARPSEAATDSRRSAMHEARQSRQERAAAQAVESEREAGVRPRTLRRRLEE